MDEVERRKQQIRKSGQSNKKLNHQDSGSQSSGSLRPTKDGSIQVNECDCTYEHDLGGGAPDEVHVQHVRAVGSQM